LAQDCLIFATHRQFIMAGHWTLFNLLLSCFFQMSLYSAAENPFFGPALLYAIISILPFSWFRRWISSPCDPSGPPLSPPPPRALLVFFPGRRAEFADPPNEFFWVCATALISSSPFLVRFSFFTHLSLYLTVCTSSACAGFFYSFLGRGEDSYLTHHLTPHHMLFPVLWCLSPG